MRRSSGLPRHAGSANRLSPLAGVNSDRPSAIESSSRPSDPARDATVRGCLARLSANLLHEVLGIILSAMPDGRAGQQQIQRCGELVCTLTGRGYHADYASSNGGGTTSRRNSFPVGPVGRLSTNQIRRGYLYAATRPLTSVSPRFADHSIVPIGPRRRIVRRYTAPQATLYPQTTAGLALRARMNFRRPSIIWSRYGYRHASVPPAASGHIPRCCRRIGVDDETLVAAPGNGRGVGGHRGPDPSLRLHHRRRHRRALRCLLFCRRGQ